MQVCTSPQTDNHANTPPLSFFTGRMPFLPPNRQRQSTEGKVGWLVRYLDIYLFYVCECWQCVVNWLQVFDEAVRAVLSPQATVRPMRKCCMLWRLFNNSVVYVWMQLAGCTSLGHLCAMHIYFKLALSLLNVLCLHFHCAVWLARFARHLIEKIVHVGHVAVKNKVCPFLSLISCVITKPQYSFWFILCHRKCWYHSRFSFLW